MEINIPDLLYLFFQHLSRGSKKTNKTVSKMRYFLVWYSKCKPSKYKSKVTNSVILALILLLLPKHFNSLKIRIRRLCVYITELFSPLASQTEVASRLSVERFRYPSLSLFYCNYNYLNQDMSVTLHAITTCSNVYNKVNLNRKVQEISHCWSYTEYEIYHMTISKKVTGKHKCVER